MKKVATLNMCDFCSKEIKTCGAETVPAKEIDTDRRTSHTPDAVIACTEYENPVDVLKKQFH
jgi:hypothetical protein